MYKLYIKELPITPAIEEYMQYIVIKKTMESILVDYKGEWRKIPEKQILEVCNGLETGKVIEETKVDKKDDQEVVKQ